MYLTRSDRSWMISVVNWQEGPLNKRSNGEDMILSKRRLDGGMDKWHIFPSWMICVLLCSIIPWHQICHRRWVRGATILLTHWGRVSHICLGKLTIISSDNGLSPERHQAIIWYNAGILLIEPLGTNFSEILNEIQTFSLKKIRLKMSSAKCCSFRLGLNVLRQATGLDAWASRVKCPARFLSHLHEICMSCL